MYFGGCTQLKSNSAAGCRTHAGGARDMRLLSTGSERKRHCLSVRSSIVTLTQNDSVHRAQNLCPMLLPPHVHKGFTELCKWLEHLSKTKRINNRLILVNGNKCHGSDTSGCHHVQLWTSNITQNLFQYDRTGLSHETYSFQCIH